VTRAVIPGAVAVVVAVLAVPDLNGGDTRMYSSGAVQRPIPSPGTTEVPIRVSGSGLLAGLAVRLRISHPHDSDLRIGLIDPRGRAYLLANHVGGGGRDFGAGRRDCRGRFATLVHEPEGPSPLARASAPFTGRFTIYDELTDTGYRLSEVLGQRPSGVWKLRIMDTRPAHGGGILHCWQLVVRRAKPVIVRAARLRVRAALSWLDVNGEPEKVHLRIWRHGRRARDGGIRRWGGFEEEQPLRLAPFLDGRLLSVRDLDSDGEPEIVLELSGTGAHCCQITEVYRYRAARRRYALTFREWGNYAEAVLRDLDRDGRPEFVSADGGFCYSCLYPILGYPLQIWEFRRGRYFDVTRRFPAVVRRAAEKLWHEYRQIRMDRRLRLPRAARTVLIDAYVAEKAMIGEGGEAWRRAGLAARRGDLGRHPRRYLRGLRAYLVKTGYLR
jgi:subtilisin-like proprotein convertase family protein